MSDRPARLRSSQMLDCEGRIRYTLTLRPDGDVEIVGPSLTVVVDPEAKVVRRPPGARVDAALFEHAATLARSPFG